MESPETQSVAGFNRRMAGRDIIFQRPTPWWQNGLTIGNGDLGGAVYGGGPESEGIISIALSKVDVWDERYDRKGHRVHTLTELRKLIAEHSGTPEGRKKLNALEPYGTVGGGGWYQKTYPYPYCPFTCKPTGIVRIDPGAAFEDFESRLSLHRGEVTFTLGDERQGASVACFADADSNVLAVRVERHGEFDRPISFQLARYVDEQLGEPEVAAEGSELRHRYVFPDGFSYALHGVVAEGEVTNATTDDGEWHDIEARNGWNEDRTMRNWEVELAARERRATVTLADEASAATLFVGAATTREAPEPLALAGELAHASAKRGYKSVRAGHRRWWDAFWRKSQLTLSDRLVEALWYQGLYLLACQSRGYGPPPTAPPGYQLPFGGWHGQLITDYNVEMTYWPIFTSNHVGLGRPFFEFFQRHVDTMKAETREVYGIDGLRFPCITDLTCLELSYLPCRNWQCVSAWMAQIYWWGYQYTGDLEFLRDTAYPIMREVAEYYRGYAQFGDDGRYHIFPSTPPEQRPWWATDPAIDMALIRVHMAATLEGSDLLGLDSELREGWRDLLEHLAPIPNDGNVFLDHRDAPADSSLAHTGLMCCTWTAGLIGLASPPKEFEMALRTFKTLPARTSRHLQGYPFDIPTWNDDCCWPNMVAYAARLGLAEEAAGYLYDLGIFQHLKPNGLFAFDIPVTDAQRQVRWAMPNGNYAMTAAVSEMLMQSYDGVIRIAPACPADWDAEFSGFLAVGAFEVDSVIKAGEARFARVHSLKGNTCRVYNPWPGRRVEVLCASEPMTFEENEGIIAFDTEAGLSYGIKPEGAPSPQPAAARPSEQKAGPISYRGPAYMGDVPDEERIEVWLGLPADDHAGP